MGGHFLPIGASPANAAIIAFSGGAAGLERQQHSFCAQNESGYPTDSKVARRLKTNVSSGPIFAERAQTLGQRRTAHRRERQLDQIPTRCEAVRSFARLQLHAQKNLDTDPPGDEGRPIFENVSSLCAHRSM
jgi:hypothetical protein